MTGTRRQRTSSARGRPTAARRRAGGPNSSPSQPASPTVRRPAGVRLQKAMADAGLGARRDCENMIAAGRVRVNGRLIDTLPCFIEPASDVVELDGAIVQLPESTAAARHAGSGRGEHHGADAAGQRIYVLVNKPKGVITTTRDPEGRRNVLDLVPPALHRGERLFPVGRLDADSTGLLLITNDGELAHLLTHPKFGLVKEYRVICAGLANEEQMKRLRAGMYLFEPHAQGRKAVQRAAMESVHILGRRVDRARGDRTLLSIRLREGRNREIRRMLARTGLKVRELERIAIGPLRSPALQPGQARLLGRQAVERLRAAALAAQG